MSIEYRLMGTIKNNGEIERYIIKHKDKNDFVKAISYDKLKILVDKKKVEWIKLDNNGNIDIDKDEIDKTLKTFKLAIILNNKIKKIYDEAQKLTLEQLTNMAVFDKKHIVKDYIASTVLGMYKSDKGGYMTFLMMYSKDGLADTILDELRHKNAIIKLEPHPSRYLALAVIDAKILLEIIESTNIKLLINTDEMNKSLNLMNIALNILGSKNDTVNDEVAETIIQRYKDLTRERMKMNEAIT